MEQLREKANCYAEENVLEVLKEAFAKVYADGYRNGYKDREKEIPVNLLNNKTEYVDLGLPSGTLWSTDYEKEGNDRVYLTYEKAVLLDIPTKEQWQELIKECEWIRHSNNFVCIGPNGKSIVFSRTGYFKIEDKMSDKEETCFWIFTENHKGRERSAGNIWPDYSVKTTELSFYCGFKLPVRLVQMK